MAKSILIVPDTMVMPIKQRAGVERERFEEEEKKETATEVKLPPSEVLGRLIFMYKDHQELREVTEKDSEADSWAGESMRAAAADQSQSISDVSINHSIENNNNRIDLLALKSKSVSHIGHTNDKASIVNSE